MLKKWEKEARLYLVLKRLLINAWSYLLYSMISVIISLNSRCILANTCREHTIYFNIFVNNVVMMFVEFMLVYVAVANIVNYILSCPYIHCGLRPHLDQTNVGGEFDLLPSLPKI